MMPFTKLLHKVKIAKVVLVNAEIVGCICVRMAKLDHLRTSNVFLVKM